MHTCRTLTLIEEVPTDGHSPMKFLCDDGNLYYCKHRIRANSAELDFLAYEVVSHALLRALSRPTPDIALVQVRAGSYRSDQLRANRRFVKPGVLCFGSRALPNADLVRPSLRERMITFLLNDQRRMAIQALINQSIPFP